MLYICKLAIPNNLYHCALNPKLSVNINKFATLRNARGGNNPNLVKIAMDCEKFGAQGITVHPRPDERHIRYADVYELKKVVKTELNIEGYPDEKFIRLVEEICPDQVTLVPDSPEVLTSNNGWNTVENQGLLAEIIARFHLKKIRVSVFLNPDIKMVEPAKKTGADRIELYTEAYAKGFNANAELAINPFKETAFEANKIGIGLNAGHDLDLNNLAFFANHIPQLLEVSIGHALVCDALYFGIQNTIQMYKKKLII
jgi:pyridoxine 5-phosphate synthase